MSNKEKILAAGQSVLSGAVVSSLFNIFKGRCTFFAIAFATIGTYGWLRLNRDLTSFAVFAGAIQSLLVIHSVKEDWAKTHQSDDSKDQEK